MSYEPDDEVKEKKLVTLNSEVIPFYLEKLEDIARDNGGHLALGKVDDANKFLQLIFLTLLSPPSLHGPTSILQASLTISTI